MAELNVDPMKRSSMYAIFGRYYGEKLYKLLFDCCSGRPGSFCYEVKKCSGIEVTYNELITLINTNSLIPGNNYLVTDFQTVTYIQYSGAGLGFEEIHEGNIEPMMVHALTPNKVDTKIESTIYPTDLITWKPFFQDREWDAVLGQSTGVITSREDTLLKLKRDFDWRNIIFRRWETVNGSGVYDNFFNTGFDYQDYTPFAPSNSYDCYIGSPLSFGPGVGTTYWLDNTIGKQSTGQMNVKFAYLNNIEGSFDTNENVEYFIGNKISEDVIFNSVTYILANFVKRIDTNTGENISNNTGNLEIYNNRCRSIGANSFDGVIEKNNVFYIQANTSSQLNCKIWENIGIEMQNNSEFLEVIGNKFNFLTYSDFGGFSFIANSFISFSNNAVDQIIQNNNFLASIYNKTFTPTAGMQSSNPSITLWDNTDGDVEQILTAGVLSYIIF